MDLPCDSEIMHHATPITIKTTEPSPIICRMSGMVVIGGWPIVVVGVELGRISNIVIMTPVFDAVVGRQSPLKWYNCANVYAHIHYT